MPKLDKGRGSLDWAAKKLVIFFLILSVMGEKRPEAVSGAGLFPVLLEILSPFPGAGKNPFFFPINIWFIMGA